VKYGLFVIYYAVPLLGAPIVSPLAAVTRILEGESLDALVVAFAVPLALLCVCWLLLRRRSGGDGGV
jgi:hypothetical protein